MLEVLKECFKHMNNQGQCIMINQYREISILEFKITTKNNNIPIVQQPIEGMPRSSPIFINKIVLIIARYLLSSFPKTMSIALWLRKSLAIVNLTHFSLNNHPILKPQNKKKQTSYFYLNLCQHPTSPTLRLLRHIEHTINKRRRLNCLIIHFKEQYILIRIQ